MIARHPALLVPDRFAAATVPARTRRLIARHLAPAPVVPVWVLTVSAPVRIAFAPALIAIALARIAHAPARIALAPVRIAVAQAQAVLAQVRIVHA